MKKSKYLSFILIFIFLISSPVSLHANYKGNDKDKGKKPLQKTTVNPSQSLININNISCWVSEEGFHDWVVASGWNGAYPNGTTVGAIFAEGLVWGGKVNDGSTPLVRVNGNTYGTGCSPITRLYRVRPDFLTGNLLQDAATFNNVSVGSVTAADIQALRDQYQIDWNEWPVDEGAPYKDVDGNGEYNSSVDIPGIPGASQTLFIKYSDALSASNYGSPPIGLEVSETYWAYSYTGALGNVIYKKVDLVYKGTPTSASNSSIDSMYIVQWADPDVGASGDDFAGCDTALNLGYAYSSGATDATYEGLGLAPPAAGYDFLQGVSTYTGNPNDSAMFNLKWRKGYKYVNPKPMSSYAYFAAGGTWGDPDFEYNGTLEFYNLMRGYLPIPRYPNSVPFPETVADVTSYGTYLLAGDPVAPTGKLDGAVDGPGDRRIMVTNGPITMHLGDTAQVVVALVAGLGVDNLASITNMKKNDETAQIVFDQLFQLPSIDPPLTSVTNLDNQVLLNWGTDVNSIDKIEEFLDKNYSFEGYEIYQLPTPSSSLTDGILLATFDAVNGVTAIYDTVLDVNGTSIPLLSADGKDAGVQRFLNIETDKINGAPLRNGQEYYFAVVSYAYNPAPLLPFHALRSPLVIYTAIPQSTAPGIRLTSVIGDTIQTLHASGLGDGTAFAIVIDPTQLTGHDYKVVFDDTTDPANVTWDLIDVTDNNRVVLSKQTNQTGDADYLTPEGFQLKVVGPPPGMKEWTITGTRRFSPVGGFAGLGLEGFSSAADPTAYDQETGTIGMAGHLAFGGIGTTLGNPDYHTVVLKLAAIDNTTLWDPLATPTDENISLAYRWLRSASQPPADPSFAPWITNPGTGYPIQGFDYSVPFSAWDMETNPPTRLAVGMFENNVVGGFVDGRYWPGNATTGDNTVAREFAFIFNAPYSTTPDPAFQNNLSNNATLPLEWVIVCSRRNDNPWTTGDEFTIVANHPNTGADVFTFSTEAPTSNSSLAKTDVEKINVFPNPYYGYHYRETSPTNHYVTFSHLPDNATIRIFDISGVLVKTITHESTKGQFDSWDLQNDNNYPVASGIYIVHVDMPELGTTKILKLAVIQEQQMLKVY